MKTKNTDKHCVLGYKIVFNEKNKNILNLELKDFKSKDDWCSKVKVERCFAKASEIKDETIQLKNEILLESNKIRCTDYDTETGSMTFMFEKPVTIEDMEQDGIDYKNMIFKPL